MLEICIQSRYQTYRKVPAALPKNSSGIHEKRLPAKLWAGEPIAQYTSQSWEARTHLRGLHMNSEEEVLKVNSLG